MPQGLGSILIEERIKSQVGLGGRCDKGLPLILTFSPKGEKEFTALRDSRRSLPPQSLGGGGNDG